MLGEDHPTTLDAVNTPAKHYGVHAKLDEGRRFVAQLIAARKRAAEKPDAVAATLNTYTWLLLTCGPGDPRDPGVAVTAATKANEMSGGTDAVILDTIALAHHLNGDTAKALEIQRQAVSLLPPGESALRSEMTSGIR